MTTETFLKILEYFATSPAGAILAMVLYDYFVRQKRNGGQNGKVLAAENATQTVALKEYVDTLKRDLKEHADTQTRDLRHHVDLKMTEGFYQMTRDLETKIEKTVENRLTAYFFQQSDRPKRKDAK